MGENRSTWRKTTWPTGAELGISHVTRVRYQIVFTWKISVQLNVFTLIILILLNKWSLPHPFLTVNQSDKLYVVCSYKFTNWMKNSVDPDQMTSSEIIWSGSTTVFKGNAYPGSPGQGLKSIIIVIMVLLLIVYSALRQIYSFGRCLYKIIVWKLRTRKMLSAFPMLSDYTLPQKKTSS